MNKYNLSHDYKCISDAYECVVATYPDYTNTSNKELKFDKVHMYRKVFRDSKLTK